MAVPRQQMQYVPDNSLLAPALLEELLPISCLRSSNMPSGDLHLCASGSVLLCY